MYNFHGRVNPLVFFHCIFLFAKRFLQNNSKKYPTFEQFLGKNGRKTADYFDYRQSKAHKIMMVNYMKKKAEICPSVCQSVVHLQSDFNCSAGV